MLKVISLFSGCGGSSLGYKMVGAKVLLAIERDPHAVASYQQNHPDTDVLSADISTLDPAEILLKLQLSPGELDILDGYPPCQGFSTAGKRLVNDPRNRLFMEYIRFLKVIQPKAFVMENVPGLVAGDMKAVFHEIIKNLKEAGYTVRARILNASHYGVPQNRRRLIILGFRNDLGKIPQHPEPKERPISFRQAVSHLEKPALILKPVGHALKLCAGMKPGESGAHLHKKYGQKGNDFSLIRVAWDKPCPTVLKTVRAGQAGLLHPEENRFLSIEELKQVCSFPKDFKLSGSFEQQWARLGNAVPPLLMSAIANTITQQLEE